MSSLRVLFVCLFVCFATNIYYCYRFPPLRPPREKHSGSIKSILQVGTGKDEDGENIESLNEKLATVGLNDGESVGFSSSVDKEYLKESKDLGTPV